MVKSPSETESEINTGDRWSINKTNNTTSLALTHVVR